jgi:hypothetical protein
MGIYTLSHGAGRNFEIWVARVRGIQIEVKR